MWETIQAIATKRARATTLLARFYTEMVINQVSLEHAVARILAEKLSNRWVCPDELSAAILTGLCCEPSQSDAIWADLRAVKERDPACKDLLTPLIDFRGFQLLQAHRAAHYFWHKGKDQPLALFIQSRCAEIYAADIHPGAVIHEGVVSDHTVGLVIGETAVVERNVTMLHGVTLGGRDDVGFDRHPKIGEDVFIGAHAQILGNIRIGKGSKVGAGAVVLELVPPYHTAVGAPAKIRPSRRRTTAAAEGLV